MIKRAYSRCNGGDYFVGPACPIDGWSSFASKELTQAVARLEREAREISMANLRHTGISDASLKRIIVIEFGSEDSVFDALSPAGYILKGEWKSLQDLGEYYESFM